MGAQPTSRFPLMASVDSRIAVGVTALAILAMAVDHLMGDDPGLEDPPTFLIASGLSLALAALVFGFVIPRAKAAAAAAERAARDGLICSLLAVVPGIAALWLGLPFILAGGGIALGLSARREEPSRRASAAIVIGSSCYSSARAPTSCRRSTSSLSEEMASGVEGYVPPERRGM